MPLEPRHFFSADGTWRFRWYFSLSKGVSFCDVKGNLGLQSYLICCWPMQCGKNEGLTTWLLCIHYCDKTSSLYQPVRVRFQYHTFPWEAVVKFPWWEFFRFCGFCALTISGKLKAWSFWRLDINPSKQGRVSASFWFSMTCNNRHAIRINYGITWNKNSQLQLSHMKQLVISTTHRPTGPKFWTLRTRASWPTWLHHWSRSSSALERRRKKTFLGAVFLCFFEIENLMVDRTCNLSNWELVRKNEYRFW